MTIGKRIKELRKVSGLTQAELGAKIFRSKSIVSKIENDEVELLPLVRQAICTVFSVREEWLLTEEGEKYTASPPTEKPKPVETSPHDDFVFIRQVNGKISAGGGLVPDDTADLQCAFRKDWLKKKGGKPDNMSLIKVEGDSMDPTLLSGDLVLVDHGRNYIAHQGGIYAVSIDHEIMIKRIQVLHEKEKIRIISDNKKYDPIDIDLDRVKVNGRVIWYARELER